MGGGGPARVLMAVVTGARGLTGEVKLKSFTEDPEAVFAYGPLSDETGTRTFSGRCAGRAKGRVFARIDGVNDRSGAEALKGARLYAPRAALPEPAEDEFYHADLIGLAAETPGGAALGAVRAVHDFGAGASVEIDGGPAGVLVAPFTRAVVTAVDIAGGRLTVELPEETAAGETAAGDGDGSGD